MKKCILFFYFFQLVLIHKNTGQNLPFRVNQNMFYQPAINVAAQSSYFDISGMIFYRNQWVGLKGAPKTFGVQFSSPITGKPFVVGFSAFSQQIGAHDAIRFSLPVSYSIKTSKDSYLAFGLSYAFTTVESDFTTLQARNPNDPFILTNASTSRSFNLNYGMYYYRQNFYAGFAANNLLDHDYTPDVNSLIDISNSTSPTLHLHVGGALHQFSKVVYKKGNYKRSSVRNQVWFSVFANYARNQPFNTAFNLLYERQKLFAIGASYSTSKEIAGLIRFPIMENTKLGYSYQFSLDRKENVNTHELILVFERNNELRKRFRSLVIPRF